MLPRDIRFAVELHVAALRRGFFPRLGAGFLRAYYRSFIDSPHAVALVADLRGQPAGMLVGTTDNRLHYAWVVRHMGVRLAAAAALGMARHPSAAWMFATTRLRRYVSGLRRHLTAKPASTSTTASAPIAVLTHVAVASGGRRSGVGRALVTALLDACASAGTRRVELVALDEEHAEQFYEALGWVRGQPRKNSDGDRVVPFSFCLPEEDVTR